MSVLVVAVHLSIKRHDKILRKKKKTTIIFIFALLISYICIRKLYTCLS